MDILNTIERDSQIAKLLPTLHDNYRDLSRKILIANSATNKQIEINVKKNKNACLFGISGISFHYNGVGRDHFIPVCNLCDQITLSSHSNLSQKLRSENPFTGFILTALLFWNLFYRAVAISTIAIATYTWIKMPAMGFSNEVAMTAIVMMLHTMITCFICASIMAKIKKNRILSVVGFYLQVLGETNITNLSEVEISIQQNRFAAFLP